MDPNEDRRAEEDVQIAATIALPVPDGWDDAEMEKMISLLLGERNDE
jgi:hypothetical protein